MIEYTKGNLLEADAEALVNTVNTVGVMGKGIALQFKQAFPEVFKAYEKACRAEEVKTGEMFIVPTGSMFNPKYIINFPTKQHWKGNSKMEFIDNGLNALVKDIKRLSIQSIAIPPLGCGNGGLNWDDVRPKIEQAFAALPDVRVLLYAPAGAPAPDQIKIGTNKPHLTTARALFIALMENYAIPGYKLTLLEIQKLAYFLQVVGESLNLRFEKKYYGPYAENLNHVLIRLEGHYTRGFGDRTRDAEIFLLPNAAKEAIEFLSDHEESRKRLERVSEIIRGYETPYGMELLSTVHWVMKENPSIATNYDGVVKAVQDWSSYKKKTFRENHILKAWQHLNRLDIVLDV
ncbi:macro domain-containing protein [Robertmurraya sp.]|uniref:type II toxin-antitoxin system antitoxin DNA ADP-ribosyl glycohydrolase DarG n=1 Tax=Robertmurraya sp. TaxID=2837525 RepID=UPI00370459EF